MITVAFNYHPELCVGCGSCVTTCLDQNDINLDIESPLRKLYKKETAEKGGVELTYWSVACMHCADMPCGTACPKGCFSKDGRTGLTILNNESCVGCHRCADACHFSAISYNIQGRASKCNGCAERLKEGMPPACAAACSRGAITVDDKNEIPADAREKLIRGIKTAGPY